ncbi:hypothetical protein KSP39_PZI003901 [Platanthera zijinensis]|uniref:Integrase catalytic domain-containing protein n=1 Tax=Platanthera zijinensis TaxID=2320716 RepID=A0AAP0BWA9_9ASPA
MFFKNCVRSEILIVVGTAVVYTTWIFSFSLRLYLALMLLLLMFAAGTCALDIRLLPISRNCFRHFYHFYKLLYVMYVICPNMCDIIHRIYLHPVVPNLLFILMSGGHLPFYHYFIFVSLSSLLIAFLAQLEYICLKKCDVFSCFQTFHKMVQTQFNSSIYVLQSDNGGKYDDRGAFGSYLISHGIIHQITCVHTSTLNGVTEQKNRHLVDVAHCLLAMMHLPKSYWVIVLIAAHLINRLPSRVIGYATSLARLSTMTVIYASYMPPYVFRCVCFVHLHSPHRDKLDYRAYRCVFLGYSSTTKGYRCYHPPSRHMFCSMDVIFREGVSYFFSSTHSL